MKRNAKSTVAAGFLALMLIAAAHAASIFPDVDQNAVYAEAVEYLNGIEVMQGDEKGNFNPDKIVSRAEMAAIVCRMMGEADSLSPSAVFSDVPITHWANKYIAKTEELGIVGGYGDGTFGPSDQVTYEQALAMVVRAMDMDELAIAAGGYPTGYLSTADEQGFTDGIEAQSGEFLNRAVIAQILYNVLYF